MAEYDTNLDTSSKYGPKAGKALDLWIKLARAYTTFNKLAVRDIAGFGLTQPQFAVMESLGHLGPMTIGELCRKMLVSGGNMTVVLDNLQKEGIIERIHNQADRRTINVRLTDKGEKMFEEMFPKHADFIMQRAAVLSDDEQEQLATLLKKLGLSLQEVDLD